MTKGRCPSVTKLPTSADRKWHGDAHDEHEEGLDQVPESQSVPGMMMELRGDDADECPIELRSYQQIINMCTLGNQQKHRKAAEEIE